MDRETAEAINRVNRNSRPVTIPMPPIERAMIREAWSIAPIHTGNQSGMTIRDIRPLRSTHMMGTHINEYPINDVRVSNHSQGIAVDINVPINPHKLIPFNRMIGRRTITNHYCYYCGSVNPESDECTVPYR